MKQLRRALALVLRHNDNGCNAFAYSLCSLTPRICEYMCRFRGVIVSAFWIAPIAAYAIRNVRRATANTYRRAQARLAPCVPDLSCEAT